MTKALLAGSPFHVLSCLLIYHDIGPTLLPVIPFFIGIAIGAVVWVTSITTPMFIALHERTVNRDHD